jgi:hypothetical protein
MNHLKQTALALALGFCVSGAAQAATNLTASLNVDNVFALYLSTDDSVLGTLIGSGNDWPTTYTFTTALTAGVDNYIHVVATDAGPPAAFLGKFTLSDADFEFGNDTQILLTDTTHWQQSYTGFGVDYFTPTSAGANGVGPWGFRSTVGDDAQWLAFAGGSTTYFSTRVTSLAPVPEPGTWALMLSGLGLLGFAARRRTR